MTSDLLLRPVREDDLVEFFLHQQDPEANRMAAFGPKDPSDRREFAAHWARVLTNPANLARTAEVDGEVVGYVSAFPAEGQTEVSYWIDPARWGRGHATAALAALLRELPHGRCTPAPPRTTPPPSRCSASAASLWSAKTRGTPTAAAKTSRSGCWSCPPTRPPPDLGGH